MGVCVHSTYCPQHYHRNRNRKGAITCWIELYFILRQFKISSHWKSKNKKNTFLISLWGQHLLSLLRNQRGITNVKRSKKVPLLLMRTASYPTGGGVMGRREKPEVLRCLCISTYNLKYLHFHRFLKIAVKYAKQAKLWEVSKVWAVGEQEQINRDHNTQSYESFYNAHFPKCIRINKFSESGNKKHSSWWWVNAAWFSRFHWNSLKESNIVR